MKPEDFILHRPPFLLVDEIVGIEGNTIRTRKRVAAGDPVFNGHFPDFPIMPGVLICEAIIQSGAIIIVQQMPQAAKKGVPVLTRINNAKFRQAVVPGDVLEMEATITDRLSSAAYLQGSARVGGKLAASLDFACSILERKGQQ